MKIRSIILTLVAALTLGTTFTSCQDMLQPSSERHSYEVAKDTLYSYWGILKSMQNIAERYVILGECRGELVSETGYVTDSIKSILNYDMAAATDGSCRYLKASDYYHVINSCNAYIADCDTARVTGTLQPYMLKELAQVEAIRAWTYLQLIQVYGEVPFYTEALLTTDDINNFMNNPGKQMVNADNIADLLSPSLEAMLPIENQYCFPQYEKYGYTSTVCHSTKCMIPLNIILGDLYLTKGDKASCEKAAQFYYNYLGNTQNTGNITPGGPLSGNYACAGYQGEGDDKPTYQLDGSTPWTERDEVSKEKEAIAAIPSSTNKLWGTVLRGVNDVFGYASEISVRTDAEDTVTTASVVLTPQYDRKQLGASQAYFNLCKSQNYELYIGASSNDLITYPLTIDPLIGDARQYWVRDVRQTYSNGISNTEKFITKQNPGGSFTTVYPMIYRKSQIWLRYAEALNGAGYPSYAFAILKNGLCNNDMWYPTESDYAIRDTAYYYYYNAQVPEDGTTVELIYPEWDEDNLSSIRHESDLIAALIAAGIIADESEYNSNFTAYSAASYENYCDAATNVVCDYIDKREVEKSPSFLNFSFTSFDGGSTSIKVPYRTSLTQRNMNYSSYTLSGTDDAVTYGVHSRGCGVLRPDDRTSTYNYVDQIAAKAKANYGVELTKADIYSGQYDDIVQKSVEDLIVDEEALELAFEGTRFFDLMRVAHRRNDPSYLANRVALRNPALASKLNNTKNWYFPLPQN